MSERTQAAPRGEWVLSGFVTATCAFAALALWISWVVAGPPKDLVAAAILLVMSMGSLLLRVHLLARVSLAAGSIVSLTACVLVGPLGGAFINAIALNLERTPRPLRVRLFNTAMSSILGAMGGLTYLWTGGAADLTQVHGVGEVLLRVGVPFMLANLVQTLTNILILGGIVWADRGEPYRPFVASMLTTTGLAQAGFGVIGFLFVVLWVPAGVGPFSAVLILSPLFVARWAFLQYSEERAAHERTLAAFVAAVGARDPHAVGHSERVAQLADWMGEALGLGAPQAVAVRYAAMLHDVGWIGSPSRQPGEEKTGFADLDSLLRHPGRGAALLSEISFLHDSLDGIRHHHERFDGLGYPSGLTGAEIPLAARVIAVADAFDTLTSHGPGRPSLSPDAALDELWARGGTQLDPAVVGALQRALERHTWSGATVLTRDSVFDHDDPATSDLVSGIGVRPHWRRP